MVLPLKEDACFLVLLNLEIYIILLREQSCYGAKKSMSVMRRQRRKNNIISFNFITIIKKISRDFAYSLIVNLLINFFSPNIKNFCLCNGYIKKTSYVRMVWELN